MTPRQLHSEVMLASMAGQVAQSLAYAAMHSGREITEEDLEVIQDFPNLTMRKFAEFCFELGVTPSIEFDGPIGEPK